MLSLPPFTPHSYTPSIPIDVSQSLEQSLPLQHSTALPVEWEQRSWLVDFFLYELFPSPSIRNATLIQPPVASNLAAEYQSDREEGVFFS